MRYVTRKGFLFIGRSLLWSLLLYVAMMAAFNWEDVSRTVLGKNAVTIMSSTLPAPSVAGENAGMPANISTASTSAASVITSLQAILRHLPH